MSVLSWNSNRFETDCVPERIFFKVNYEKRQKTKTEVWKITQHDANLRATSTQD